MNTASHDTANELAELTFSVVKFTITLAVVLSSATSQRTAALLIRSFRAHYPHRSLTLWLVTSLSVNACALLSVALSHSFLAWITLFGLLGLALASLAVLERVLSGLAAHAAPPADLPTSRLHRATQ